MGSSGSPRSNRKMDPESWPRPGPIRIPCLGVYSVFIPLPYTLSRKDLSKNILDSIKSGDGVKVFIGFREGNRKILNMAPN